ncbi:MAG: cation transporter [Verrucomicrobiia bacterium]|jgi:copper chaperone CopZ
MRKLIIALAFFAATAVASAETLKLEIKGMVCEAGCVTAVKNSLTKVKGVDMKKTKVVIGKATVQFNAKEAKKAAIIKAIEKAGYIVVKKKKETGKTADKDKKTT